MLKRVTALLLLASMLLAVLPVSAAELNTPVEDFTVKQTDSGFTVILPDGYAEKGFFKLFWKNDLTGETLNAVFPADTTAYQIEAGAGAKYSFQLFYAKKRGLLPAAWKEEAPKGPTVWKVLWLDLETIDYLGITNNMSEQNHLASQRLARAFESFVEESTDGLVDIEITRMSIDQPVTALSYDPVFGYTIKPSDIDVKHLAFRKYDSVLAMARLDRFALKYAGVAFDPDNPREEPGYAVIVMMGDNPTPKGMADMKAVCLHEWLHLLSYFYSEWQLEIPNPDTPEQFGFDPFKGNRDLQYFKEALTMKAQANDGRFLGVPAEAWQYKPTHNPEKWNLSYLQEQEIPADFQPREEITVVSDEAVQEYDASAAPEGYKYENEAMGLGCVLENWGYYSLDDYRRYLNVFRSSSSAEYSDEDPDFLKNDDSAVVMYAESFERPNNMALRRSTSAVPFMKQNGEAAYVQEINNRLDRLTARYIYKDFNYEITQRKIGNREMYGIKQSYPGYGDCMEYYESLYWLDGDYMYSIEGHSSMFDNCDSILDQFYFLAD